MLFTLPQGFEARKFLEKEVSRLYNSDSVYDRFLLVKIMENKEVGNFVKNHLNLKENTASLKRKIFRSILEESHIVNFSLSHLIALGDNGSDLFWWAVL